MFVQVIWTRGIRGKKANARLTYMRVFTVYIVLHACIHI